jgi:hypothetical protein
MGSLNHSDCGLAQAVLPPLEREGRFHLVVVIRPNINSSSTT